MSNLPRRWIMIDKKGRITIPEYLRIAFGLPEDQEYPVVIEAYPNLENCNVLFIKKGQ